VVGVLGILMAVSAGTGLAFHWRRLRRDLFVLAPRAHPRKAWSSIHKFGGVWALPFHLLTALTGRVAGAGIADRHPRIQRRAAGDRGRGHRDAAADRRDRPARA
jgi:hypothetical protein